MKQEEIFQSLIQDKRPAKKKRKPKKKSKSISASPQLVETKQIESIISDTIPTQLTQTSDTGISKEDFESKAQGKISWYPSQILGR